MGFFDTIIGRIRDDLAQQYDEAQAKRGDGPLTQTTNVYQFQREDREYLLTSLGRDAASQIS